MHLYLPYCFSSHSPPPKASGELSPAAAGPDSCFVARRAIRGAAKFVKQRVPPAEVASGAARRWFRSEPRFPLAPRCRRLLAQSSLPPQERRFCCGASRFRRWRTDASAAAAPASRLSPSASGRRQTPVRSGRAPSSSPASSSNPRSCESRTSRDGNSASASTSAVDKIALSTTPIFSAAILNSAANSFQNLRHRRDIFLARHDRSLAGQLIGDVRHSAVAIARFRKAVLHHVHFRARRREPVPQFAELVDLHPLVIGHQQERRAIQLFGKIRNDCRLFLVSW